MLLNVKHVSGTSSDKDAAAPTNISRLDELVVNDPDGVQITRYSTGVGTGLNCVVQIFGGKSSLFPQSSKLDRGSFLS